MAPEKRRSYYLKTTGASLKDPQLKDWVIRVPGDPYMAYCKYCKSSMRANRYILKRHCNTIKHKQLCVESSSDHVILDMDTVENKQEDSLQSETMQYSNLTNNTADSATATTLTTIQEKMDEDDHFCQMLVPIIRSMDSETKSFAKIQIQLFLHKLRYPKTNFNFTTSNITLL